MIYKLIGLITITISFITSSFALVINIEVPSETYQNSIVQLSVDDVKELLSKATKSEVYVNKDVQADFIIKIFPPEEQYAKDKDFFSGKNYPFVDFPKHSFSWRAYQDKEQFVLELKSPSAFGISCGLYALLQEKLQFQFYHTKESIIPNLENLKLQNFTFEGKPNFHKKGFHIHAMHPLELTEPFLDYQFENGISEIKQYIDWLARNGQNYFDFNLLSSIDKVNWAPYAKEFVDYAHQRGILVGLDLSLHMIQQRAYQLVKYFPWSFKKYEKQIDKNLDYLFAANWDFINIEFSTAEFVGGKEKLKIKLKHYIIEQVREKYKSNLIGRMHVVKEDNEMRKQKNQQSVFDATDSVDYYRGILIHSVMFYSLTDEKAKVYENEDFSHLLQALKKENEIRETWYYPESAYWITFDNSIPLFLFPYLSARLDDIKTCIDYDIPNHITFSSGWEWGYWLVDWSIARWSWSYSFDEKIKDNHPTENYLNMVKRNRLDNFFNEALTLQNYYFKDLELMRYMCPSQATDELPFFKKGFQPQPEKSYKYLAKKSNLDDIKKERNTAMIQLEEYANKSFGIVTMMEKSILEENDAITEEFKDALLVSSLRAKHKQSTLNYILTKREAKLTKNKELKNTLPAIMEQSQGLRAEALKVVKRQEQKYRYPLKYINEPFKSKTVYDYGYLYPASNLHFWHREEKQAEKSKFSAFYMNIFDYLKIVGVKK
jgi:hypothetical protein